MEVWNCEEGDILITNHPAFGGSHLPDVTVITPVFVDGERIGFTASRAHHAEIGGKRPGSMPPDATRLSEEGVVIPPMFLARKGEFRWDPIKEKLTGAEWPTRSLQENMADLQSAVSANHRGAEKLKNLAKEFGTDEVTRYMQKLKEYAVGTNAIHAKGNQRMEHTVQKRNWMTDQYWRCRVQLRMNQ